MGVHLRRRNGRTAAVVAVLTAAMGLIVTGPANAAQFCNTAPIVFTPPGSPTFAVQPFVPYPSVIPVSGLAGTVTDVNVTFNDFTYPFPEDVDVLLVAPDGSTRLLVMSDIGGNNDNTAEPVSDVDLTFDDEAPGFAPTDSQLTSGTYRPTDDDDDIDDFAADTFPGAAPAPSTSTSLSVFDGIQPNGDWRLYVVDDDPGPPEPGDFGGGWCIDITTSDTSTTSSTVAPTSSTSSSTPTSTSTSTSLPPISTSTSTSTTMVPTSTSTSTSTSLPPISTSTSTSTTMAPTSTSTSTSTSTTMAPSTSTSTTLAPTTSTSTTLAPTTSTSIGSTTTSTVPPGDACAGILADRAAFNARYDDVRAALIRSLSGDALTGALAALEATRASGNAQFARLLETCGTPLPTTSTTAPTTTSTVVTTTTTTVPPTGDQCAQLRADRAAFNTRISSFQATLSQSLSGAQLAAALAQLEATRAQGNAQFASQAAALGCTL